MQVGGMCHGKNAGEECVYVCVCVCQTGGALFSLLLWENPESHQVQTPASSEVSGAASNSCWTAAPHPKGQAVS